MMGDIPPAPNNSLEEREIKNLSRPRKKFWPFALGLIGLVVLVVGGYVGYQLYQLDQGRKAVGALAQRMNREAEEFARREMADTYGGKTPQETLQMYIDAVEKGDYELASKYFVIGKQEGELTSLQNAPRENISSSLNLLKQAIRSDGSYSARKDGYAIREPILVDFILYPSGVWKIEEI